MAEHWYETTALDELLGVDSGLVDDTRLYRALDRLGEPKDRLCAHLMERYRQWFGTRLPKLSQASVGLREANEANPDPIFAFGAQICLIRQEPAKC